MPTPRKPAAAKAAGRVIDLDAARAARQETADDPAVIRFGGKDFELPRELPLDFAIAAQHGDLRGIVKALLNGQSDEFFELGPSLQDVEMIADQAAHIYGVAVGDSSASPSS